MIAGNRACAQEPARSRGPSTTETQSDVSKAPCGGEAQQANGRLQPTGTPIVSGAWANTKLTMPAALA